MITRKGTDLPNRNREREDLDEPAWWYLVDA